MEALIILAVVYTAVAGLCYFLLNSLPLDLGPMKAWGLWVIVAIYVVLMVLKVVIPLIEMVIR